MKKAIYAVMMLVLASSLLFAQGAKDPDLAASFMVKPETEVRVAALKGPTAMGLSDLIDRSQAGALNGNRYSFQLEGAVDAVTPLVVKGDVDFAALPANLAAVLYKNTSGKVQVVGINTLGVLYIVENGSSVSSVEDLRGKTIYSAGKGATPEYALNYILGSNGLEIGKDVFIEWKSEHAECVAALAADSDAVAMLPQPFATTAMMKNSSMRTALDLNKLWEEKVGSVLITGVTVVRREFAENNPDALKAFLEDYAASVNTVNTDNARGAKLVGGLGIVPEQVALKALPFCNITLITGEEMKEALSNYLSILFEQNPKSVGGALPGEDFYL